MPSHRMVTATALAAALVALGPALAGCSSGSGPDPDASSAVRQQGPGDVRPGASASGSTTATYRAGAASAPLSGEEMRRTADRLRARARTFGLTGSVVEVHGTTITATAPGDSADELRQMAATAELSFRPVLPDSELPADLRAQYTALSCGPGGTPLVSAADRPTAACDRKLKRKYLLGPVALDGTDVKSAGSDFAADVNAGAGAEWIVNLDFTPSGRTKFARVTGTLSQRVSPANQFAILIDGDVLSAPAVAQTITGGKAQITGGFTRDSAEHLAALVTTGALPVQLTVSGITRQP